ncbi:MAG TPA: OB-fold nucleic acid binding domain-containing protein [Pirellulales bacterium]|jgi:3'-5' exoribonuclease|nr:OB-fold nucleic acid binding domain-containing protein [Pirellulales bacterium]
MPRRLVSQFGHQEAVDQVFLVSQKQLRPNRNGNLYLQVELSDRSGTISARMWNASESDYRNFDDGDFVRVEGNTQLYQGCLQLIASNICKAHDDEIDYGDFMPITPQEIDRLAGRLRELLRGMKNAHLLTLAECFLIDDEFMGRFTRAPAGVKNHHAYVGGLLEHVVNLMEVCARVAPFYPRLDPDVLLMGAFLHDSGKTGELSYDRGFAYTDEGQLIGHVVMAIGMLDAKLQEAERLGGEAVPEELALRLKHMIVSHHGQYEFGSPKLPMTLEAVALHHLDNLDAKLHNFEQQMRDDPNVESCWTAYNQNLGRKLFKGRDFARERRVPAAERNGG